MVLKYILIMNAHGQLIDSLNSRDWLRYSVSKATLNIDICSAYLKKDSLEYFLDSFSKNNFMGSVRILSRWKPHDLVSGASDLVAYELASKNNIPFFIKQDFHGKVYSINPAGILVGSANLTNSGFQIHDTGNDEICTTLNISKENSSYIDNLFKSSHLITQSLYLKIKDELSRMGQEVSVTSPWSESLLMALSVKDLRYQFLVDETIHCDWKYFLESKNLNTPEVRHDLSLLGCTSNLNIDAVKHAFPFTNIYRWLVDILKKNGGEMYFGELSAALHDALIDDPRPYRRDVKTLLQNLMGWCEFCVSSEVIIERPKYSQRIKLINI
jgi:hypothetical protein